MKLILDTCNTKFQMGGEFTPRLDKDGNQRRDKSGGTNLPNGWLESTTLSNAPQQLALLARMARGKESPLAALPAGSAV